MATALIFSDPLSRPQGLQLTFRLLCFEQGQQARNGWNKLFWARGQGTDWTLDGKSDKASQWDSWFP